MSSFRVSRTWLFALVAAACVPDLGARDSLVTENTILAVRGEPPEATPGTSVHYDVLVATPDGPAAFPAQWGYCTTGKLLVENGSVSGACERNAVNVVGEGPPQVDATVPANACTVFGPLVTTQDQRPRDPDITGGYYQPIRVISGGKMGFGFERVDCGAITAPIDVVEDYKNRYHANTNPTLDPIVPPPAARGSHIVLRASWPATAVETFPVYDAASRVLVDHRESMRVSWFTTAGTFDDDRTGRDETETELFTENGWTAPATAQTVHFFVVLRDQRGGTTFTTFDVAIN